MIIVNKKSIDFEKDIGLNIDGEPMKLICIDFEPYPLLPTYSFIFKNNEIRYSLNKNPRKDTPLDLLNCYYLELLTPNP